MAFPALLDTNVLFSATLTDTLLRLAEQDAFRPLWSLGILRELQGVLVRETDVTQAKAERRIRLMQASFPMAEVSGYESLIDSMTCQDRDRHVLAAAVHAGAQVLVSSNLRDFPEPSTTPYDVNVVSPDAFLLDQLDLYPAKVGREFLTSPMKFVDTS